MKFFRLQLGIYSTESKLLHVLDHVNIFRLQVPGYLFRTS